MSVIRDVTQRKKTEKALLESEKSFKAMIEQMPDGIVIEEPDRILFVNPSLVRMLGYGREEDLVGRPPLSLVPPHVQETIRKRITDIDAHGGVNPLLKYPVIRKDGSLVEVEVSSFSTFYGGKPVVVAVVRDMTLQNQMERQATLNEKLATVGTLAAGVAHEINNPLTYVLANLVFSKEHFDELKAHTEARGVMDEKSRKLFADLREEMADTLEGGERIRDIVKGLKSFVHTSGDEVEPVELNPLIESAVNLCLHEIKRKAQLEKDFAPDLPVLRANPGKLQQVFINLLINATQAIEGKNPEENKIRVRTGRDAEGLFAEFTDNGKGIPEKVLPHIFEPFFTTKPVGVGTGLGLYICADIVRGYQGRLEVQSREGKGTTFTVRLPASEGRPEAAPAPGLPPPNPARGRVLVVDDEPGNLEVLRRILKKNHEVLAALTGLDAMSILEREGGRVDAVVTDINMPDMNGVDFYKTVAAKFPGLEKKMVFITGGLFDQGMADFLKTVPNTCLEKPFTFEDILRAVSQSAGPSPKG
jgi:two-component system, cell cycle sensor histidine kinase and response regulator CckA